MTDPVGFFRERWVELFNRGVSLLDKRAAESERARRIVDDVRGADGAAWLAFEGAGEVWLRWKDGALTAPEARPEGVPIRLAVSMPSNVAELWVNQGVRAADLDAEETAVRTARSVSKRVEEAVGDEGLSLHLIIVDTPDFDEVIVRIGVHVDAPPDSPQFTATVDWDSLASAREKGENLQQLFMTGRLKLGGDYSHALQLGMRLMQQGPL